VAKAAKSVAKAAAVAKVKAAEQKLKEICNRKKKPLLLAPSSNGGVAQMEE
jgi:hypothetical protein